MVRKIALPTIILVVGVIAQSKFNLIGNHLAFHIITGALMAWIVFSFVASCSRFLPSQRYTRVCYQPVVQYPALLPANIAKRAAFSVRRGAIFDC